MASHSTDAFAGLAVVTALATVATLVPGILALLPAFAGVPLSPVLVAIVLGLACAGAARTRPSWAPGLQLAAGPLLKFAVMLIGLRLSLAQLGVLGLQALPLVLGALVTGLGLALWLGRMLGVGRKLTALVAVGSAICGASAIAATAPALRPRPEETAYALACVALFGLAATILYPWLLQAWLGDARLVGLVLGAAVHDTAQVTAAAVLHEQTFGAGETVAAATVTKLLRNLTMMIVIPWIVWWGLRGEKRDGAETHFPLFVLGFIGFAALRSTGDWLVPDAPWWQWVISLGGDASAFLFAMAMAAIGMQIRLAALRALGPRPALIALLTALGMGAVALGLVRLLA
ncbi:putative sulfate exporter family transporter [Thioalkalivibrio sp. XN8]|uniref:putative sulfate exporter family transporter n=1 Tax=Thioalkalivibrio sp. XN8 TaxID=2712863 RepID=UPI0013EC8803|nr:putative sulfate exporter family transporter [Thioalkalivibrio sp. XN8]